MTWFAVFIIFLFAIIAILVCSLAAFSCGWGLAKVEKSLDIDIKKWDEFDDLVKKQASKECDRLLKQEIGKTLAGVNDGKRYNWKIHFDNDGKDKCSVTRFGVDDKLSDIVNVINRRAIQWGCDITLIEVERVDVG